MENKIKVFLIFLVLVSKINFVHAQDTNQKENLNVLDNWLEWTDGNNMLTHYLNDKAFELIKKRDIEIASLETKVEWMQRQKKVKELLTNTFGPFPVKTELNAKITGIVEKEDYIVEKIIFESMPNFFVSAALFKPKDLNEKRPAILYLSGHSQEAFRYDEYQIMILNLVKKGFIVLAIDPIGQGEMIQYYNSENKKSLIGESIFEHSYFGRQCFLLGVSPARYFIWNGIRAVDYLISREDVDSVRIGITGQSGGGTQSTYIFALDERIKAAAIVNYITGFRRLIESIGPQDAEQNFYKAFYNGLDHADFIEARAPNPCLIAANTRDFFSIQGTRETFEEIKKSYKAFGKEENIQLVEDDYIHGYTKKLRESIYSFFQKNFNLNGNTNEEKVSLLNDDELKITSTGNVGTSEKKSETVFSINKNDAEVLINNIQKSRQDIETHLQNVHINSKELSDYNFPNSEIKSVFRGRYQRVGYSVEMYALNSESNYVIPLLLFIPKTENKHSSIIYIHPKGKISDAEVGNKIEELVKLGYLVAAIDVLGIGELENKNYGTDFLALMIGTSIVGIQASDISRVVNFLKQREDIDSNNINSIAFDEMCPVLIHAAAFNKTINSIVLNGSLISYQSIVMNKFYDSELTKSYVTGALKAYDIPDLIGCIAPRKIAFVGLKDQMNKPATKELIDNEMLFPRSVYSNKNCKQNLKFIPPNTDIKTITNWCFEE